MRVFEGRSGVFAQLALVVLLVPLALTATAAPAAPAAREALELRSMWTDEFGATRPQGVVYLPSEKSLLVLVRKGAGTEIVRVSGLEQELGKAELPDVADAGNVAVDPVDGSVDAVSGDDVVSASSVDVRTQSRPPTTRSPVAGLDLDHAAGVTFDAKGTMFILDTGAGTLVSVPRRARDYEKPSTVKLGIDAAGLRGLAFNPANGRFYTARPGHDELYALDRSGALVETLSLEDADVMDLRGLAFAPSPDPTDDAATQHLFIADAGSASSYGRVLEVSLAPAVVAAAPSVSPTLVQTIQTSQFSPPSPDPAGITYMPATDSLLIADSEVDEMTIYQGANLFRTTLTGGVQATGTTTVYSQEPTGVAYDAQNNRLFVSDDNRARIFIVQPGTDGTFGTPDDTRTYFSTSALGIADCEGVTYDPDTGHLYVSDGTGIEVWRIDPVNGVFGDGNDAATSFDIAQYGARDAEGIAFDRQQQTLVVVDPYTGLYELSKTGTLLRTMPLSAIIPGTNEWFGDVGIAPSSSTTDAPTVMNYYVADRAVDNNSNPNENDGKVYELSAPSGPPVDTPPSVTLTAPAEGATVSGVVTVSANASDDNGVTQVQFAVDGTVVGVDTNGTDGWSTPWNAALASNGAHTVTATATDTAAQTGSDSNGVTVSNAPADTPPTANVTAPAEGSTVSGTVTVTATASDDNGVTQVQFFVDGVSIGTDTSSAGGWSVSWNTTSASNGAHTVTATARDTAGQTGSDSNGVTVSNGGGGTTVTFEKRVITGVDDAEQVVGVKPDRGSSDLDLVVDKGTTSQYVGLRFTAVTVPKNATITAAYLQFRADTPSSGAVSLLVRAQAVDNAPGFTSAVNNLSSRTLGTASTAWSPVAWTILNEVGAKQRTPSLVPALQQLVNRAGWASGNSLVLMITGTGKRTADSFEAGYGTLLHIEYTTP